MVQFYSKESPEMVALKDYQNNDHSEGVVMTSLTLSTFSIPIYKLESTQYIVNTDSEDILDFLSSSDERVWFMMNGEIPMGLIVVDYIKPIRMGGENRSKDVYQMYQNIIKLDIEIKEIKYIEFEGQPLLMVSHSRGEDMYLSQGASSVLALPANQKTMMYEVIQKMKKRIMMSN